ncbi:MAG: hypothetical protein IJA10_15325 [Lachnospiraceae bacterium]|nr:hypothetical protein [Lachnospiraceae bacterium]
MKDRKKTPAGSEKKKEHPILLAVVCFVVAVFFGVTGIGIWEDLPVVEGIFLAIIVIVLVFSGVILIYAEIWKKKTKTELYMREKATKRKLREHYCKEQQKLRRNNEDMFHTVYRYMVRKCFPAALVVFTIVLLFLTLWFDYYDYGLESHIIMYTFMAVAGISFVVYCVYLFSGGYVKQFKKCIFQDGYDMTELK